MWRLVVLLVMASVALFVNCSASISIKRNVEPSFVAADYRKDFYYPYDMYPEYHLPDPSVGGRIQLIAAAMDSGNPGDVYIAEQLVNTTSGDWDYDWVQVYPPTNWSIGTSVFIRFHSRQKLFDNALQQGTPLTIRVMDRDNPTLALVDANWMVQIPVIRISYVVQDPLSGHFLIHLQQQRTPPADQEVLLTTSSSTTFVGVSKIRINEHSLTVNTTLCPQFPVKIGSVASSERGEATICRVALSGTRLQYGDALNVVVEYDSTLLGGTVLSPSVAALRFTTAVVSDRFNIETWQSSSDCPYPGVNDEAYEFHRSHYVDTFFLSTGSLNKCNTTITAAEMVNDLAQKNDFWVLWDAENSGGFIDPSITSYSRISAAFLADEADNHVDDVLREKVDLASALFVNAPEVPTYMGGHVSRMSGVWSGFVDFQGMDMYVAACAPHVQEFLHWPPLRGSYDYLRAARENHLPGPTWSYSQALGEWDAKVLGHVLSHRSPDPSEFLIQAQSVVAAGSKGVMYFQTKMDRNSSYPDTWAALGAFSRDVQALGRDIRMSDPGGSGMISSTSSSESAIVDVLVGPRTLILPLVSTKADGGYDDEGCAVGLDMHWKVVDSGIAMLNVTIPVGFGDVVDVFDVRCGELRPIPAAQVAVDIRARVLQFSGIVFRREYPIRTIVVANTPDVRSELDAYFASHPLEFSSATYCRNIPN